MKAMGSSSASSSGGSGASTDASAKNGEVAPADGEKIEYPAEEINPDDIPF